MVLNKYCYSNVIEITCPNCGVKDSDSWEQGDEGELDCEKCGCTFEYIRDVTVTYSSKPLNMEELDNA